MTLESAEVIRLFFIIPPQDEYNMDEEGIQWSLEYVITVPPHSRHLIIQGGAHFIVIPIHISNR